LKQLFYAFVFVKQKDKKGQLVSLNYRLLRVARAFLDSELQDFIAGIIKRICNE
jgi:hypothetical protein